jgi:hypothetical protein
MLETTFQRHTTKPTDTISEKTPPPANTPVLEERDVEVSAARAVSSDDVALGHPAYPKRGSRGFCLAQSANLEVLSSTVTGWVWAWCEMRRLRCGAGWLSILSGEDGMTSDGVWADITNHCW